MYNSKTHVVYELKRLLTTKRRYQERLEQLPQGYLKLCASNGRPYYMRLKDGQKQYLGNGAKEEVQKLQERRFLEVTIRNIEYNQGLMEQYLDQYRPTEPHEVMQSLPKAYQRYDTYWAEGILNPKQWEFADYNKSNFHPEHLTHKTQKGEFVRSKSEALIADILYERGIPYHYEERLLLGDKTVVPDFKVLVRSENRFKFLEHCTMIENERYIRSFIWKMQQYQAHGYLPWRDIFYTFDDVDGSIDTFSINKMLDHYFE